MKQPSGTTPNHNQDAFDRALASTPISREHRGLLAMSMLFFTFSGFAALIYQSVWSSYLGLLLGHAAYAQALVLSIFMGGMAIGSWLASRIDVPVNRLLFAYGLIEVGIGLLGVLFHQEYLLLANFSLNHVLPNISSTNLALTWQWLSGALLVLPQSILLGMTFPVLGAACVRKAEAADASVLGSLYFANSMGAVFGALVATFLLVPNLGTPGALRVAGLTNLLIGTGALMFGQMLTRTRATPADADLAHTTTPPALIDSRARRLLIAMFWAAGITGATSFVYEVTWVRLLNLAMGSTQHSFELMLSAFILGLALGGLAVRQWARRGIDDVVYVAGLAQVAMGVVSLLCLVVYAQSFNFIEWLMAASSRGAEGYTLYLFGSASLALVTVTPAAFFAGMTLPLMTAAVIGAGHGTDKIGKVYAANTLGAICGVFLTLHVLVPLMGLRLSLTLAALIDVFVGVVLIRIYSSAPRRLICLGALLLSVTALASAQTLGHLTAKQLSSGVYRHGVSQATTQLVNAIFLRDGKSATVSILDSPPHTRTIATNGKADASIQMNPSGPRTWDQITMSMAAALPLALRDHYDNVAIIGFGSGLTTHTLMGSPNVGHVDTIEIEPAMVEAARTFGWANERAYKDPRSNIVIHDARTFFAIGNKQYDLIISEPSNPWVNGVASLFTVEFYDEIVRHLHPQGVLVQWIQAYELNDPLLATMFAAVVEKFAYVDVYITNGTDLLLLARQDPNAIAPIPHEQADASFRKELAGNGISRPGSYTVRKIAETDGVRAYIRMFAAKPHSDFFPVVSLHAPEARFRSQFPEAMIRLSATALPLQQMAHGRPEIDPAVIESSGVDPEFPLLRAYDRARLVSQSLLAGRVEPELYARHHFDGALLSTLFALSAKCRTGPELSEWIDSLVNVGVETLPLLLPEQLSALFTASTWFGCQRADSEEGQWLNFMLAIANRNAPAMEKWGMTLARSNSASASAKQSAALAVMLARLAQQDYAGVNATETELGVAFDEDNSMFPTRSYLLALADERAQRHQPLTPRVD